MINGTVRLLLLKGLCFCPLGTPGQLSGSEHKDSLAICFLTQNFLESIMNLHFSQGVCTLACERTDSYSNPRSSGRAGVLH